jgi:hypothetical protein
VPLVLFAIFPPLLEACPITLLACLRRGRKKKQLSEVISMERFILEHQVFLYNCYVKCKSARKCKGKLRRKLLEIQAPHRNILQNLVKKLQTSGVLINKNTNHRHTVLT